MKKCLAFLLALIMVLGLAACGSGGQSAGNENAAESGAAEQEPANANTQDLITNEKGQTIVRVGIPHRSQTGLPLRGQMPLCLRPMQRAAAAHRGRAGALCLLLQGP